MLVVAEAQPGVEACPRRAAEQVGGAMGVTAVELGAVLRVGVVAGTPVGVARH